MEEIKTYFLESISQRAEEDIRVLREEAASQREEALAGFGREAELRAEDIRRRGIAGAESEGARMLAARESEHRRQLLEDASLSFTLARRGRVGLAEGAIFHSSSSSSRSDR